MSFVDDLNRRVSNEELIKEEEKQIERDLDNIISVIKGECWSRRYVHKLKGYYGWDGWDNKNILVQEFENAVTFNGIFRSSYDSLASKPFDTSKFVASLEYSLRKLGFEKFQVKLIPVTRYEKVENGTGILGNKKYKEITKTDYKLYFELEW